jgi:hypothetical protein
MRFLLLNDLLKDLLEAAWSLDRVAVDLTAQQDEDASRDGEDRHNNAQAREAQAEQCNQTVQNEPDCQQEHANISGDVHCGTPFLCE